MDFDSEWWGYSKEHGWVVLDRRIPCNLPGARLPLEFVRSSDGNVYDEKREKWDRPHYQYAPNYLNDLKGDAAVAAAAELETFKAVWPEMQARVNQERSDTASRGERQRIERESAQDAEAGNEKAQDKRKKQ